jgi:hypothetical protein
MALGRGAGGISPDGEEEREEEQRETYYDLTEDQFALLAQTVAESDGALEIVAHTAHDGNGSPVGPAESRTSLRTLSTIQSLIIG